MSEKVNTNRSGLLRTAVTLAFGAVGGIVGTLAVNGNVPETLRTPNFKAPGVELYVADVPVEHGKAYKVGNEVCLYDDTAKRFVAFDGFQRRANGSYGITPSDQPCGQNQ